MLWCRAEKVRYHTCDGINEGPRIHDASLVDVAGYVLKVNAGSYALRRQTPSRARVSRVGEDQVARWQSAGPWVIIHANNVVEHPELIAERLVRFAKPRFGSILPFSVPPDAPQWANGW
jgi:5-methyltetrahydropteroyltriglutamate--homocysteine methyltransferase